MKRLIFDKFPHVRMCHFVFVFDEEERIPVRKYGRGTLDQFPVFSSLNFPEVSGANVLQFNCNHVVSPLLVGVVFKEVS